MFFTYFAFLLFRINANHLNNNTSMNRMISNNTLTKRTMHKSSMTIETIWWKRNWWSIGAVTRRRWSIGSCRHIFALRQKVKKNHRTCSFFFLFQLVRFTGNLILSNVHTYINIYVYNIYLKRSVGMNVVAWRYHYYHHQHRIYLFFSFSFTYFSSSFRVHRYIRCF